jgi:hypothetical protein
MLTLVEVKEKLMRIEETILLEILNINSEELVERFYDRIEERYDSLVEDLSDDEEYD